VEPRKIYNQKLIGVTRRPNHQSSVGQVGPDGQGSSTRCVVSWNETLLIMMIMIASSACGDARPPKHGAR
jgi:hypothetical protein